jgi:photosystem II stability/assembly factor-like uncharacterized protein
MRMIVLVSLFYTISFSQWKIVNEIPKAFVKPKENYSNIFAFNSKTIKIVGADGALTESKNYGADWTTSNPSEIQNLSSIYDVQYIDENTAYMSAVTQTSVRTIFRSINGGKAWTKVNQSNAVPGRLSFQSAFIGVGTDIVGSIPAEGDDSIKFYKTKDGGATWSITKVILGWSQTCITQTLCTEPAWIAVTNIKFVSESKGYVFTSAGTYKTLNGGDSWQFESNLGTARMYDIAFDGSHGICVGGWGLIRSSFDGGLTWNTPEVNIEAPSLNKIAYGANGYWIAIGASTIQESKNNGQTWEESFSNKEYTLMDLALAKDNSSFVVGSRRLIMSKAGPMSTAKKMEHVLRAWLIKEYLTHLERNFQLGTILLSFP